MTDTARSVFFFFFFPSSRTHTYMYICTRTWDLNLPDIHYTRLHYFVSQRRKSCVAYPAPEDEQPVPGSSSGQSPQPQTKYTTLPAGHASYQKHVISPPWCSYIQYINIYIYKRDAFKIGFPLSWNSADGALVHLENKASICPSGMW